jgi:hypothetical protein
MRTVLAFLRVERGEQVRGPVTPVVMCSLLRFAERDRQHRLCPLQSLYLRLLVEGQDQRVPPEGHSTMKITNWRRPMGPSARRVPEKAALLTRRCGKWGSRPLARVRSTAELIVRPHIGGRPGILARHFSAKVPVEP